MLNVKCKNVNYICGITGSQTRRLVDSDVYMVTFTVIRFVYCQTRRLNLQWQVSHYSDAYECNM